MINLTNTFNKYSKIIETVHFRNEVLNYFSGDDSTKNFEFKLLLFNEKILLFKRLDSLLKYLKIHNNIFDKRQTMLLVKKLEEYDPKSIRKWLSKNKYIINIDFLQKEISKPRIDYENIQLHIGVFNLISLLKDYFDQINDTKHYKTLDSKLFNEYYDLFFTYLIFSKVVNKKVIQSLIKVLKSKPFRYYVENFQEYIYVMN